MSTVPVVTVATVNVTAKITNGSLRLSLNTLDFTLNNPTSVPALGAAVTVNTPSWSGTVSNVATRANDRGTILFARVTATNTTEAGAASAPFGLSDTPNNTTTFGYRDLEVTNTRVSAGDQLRATLECWREGLAPGQTVALTSALHGFSATGFTITDMDIGWNNDDAAVYRVHLGDEIVTMSVWANSAEGGLFPITSTKITDGAVTTPKLYAGAVTAEKMMVGGVSNLINNPDFETGTPEVVDTVPGWTVTTSAGGLVQIRNDTGSTVYPASGAQFLEITNAGTANSAVIMSNSFPVSADDRVGVSWHQMYGGSGTGIEVFIKCFDKAGSATFVTGAGFIGTSAYQRVSRLLTPAAGTVRAQLGFQYNAAASVSAYIDNISAFVGTDALHAASGNVVIDSSGVTITNGALTFLDAYGSTAMNGNGFGVAWAKFIASGLYNADIAIAPPTPASNLSSPSNLVPFWGLAAEGGATITAKSITSTSSPSGRVIEYSSASGTAGDRLYLTQFVPVRANRAMTQRLHLHFVYKNAASPTSAHAVAAVAQFYKADGVTTTGGEVGSVVGHLLSADAGSAVVDVGVPFGSPPVDAAFALVKVGMWRKTTNATTAVVELSDMRLIWADAEVVLGDGTDTAAGYGTVYQSGKVLWLSANQGGATGTQPSLVLDGSTGATGGTSYLYYNGTDYVSVGANGDLWKSASNQLRTYSDFIVSQGLLVLHQNAGPISDSDFMGAALNGAVGIDYTNHRLYYREGGAWHYIDRTAGFQIPVDVDGVDERICPRCGVAMLPGQPVAGILDGHMDDGALHGVWCHLGCLAS